MCHTTTFVRSIDYHTAGEPFRIVVGGGPEFAAATVADRRREAQQSPQIDFVRRLLCREPRGHSDMYGCFVVPADDEGADFGALFWHNDGYSTACGHGTIALGVWAVQSGRVAGAPDGTTAVTIDVPSGRVIAQVRQASGMITGVVFENVPSYPVGRAVPVQTSVGEITADLSYGGAFYASVPASALGLEVTPEHYARLVALGREIKWALNDSDLARHPEDDRLSGIYGTIVYDDLGDFDSGPHQRSLTIFGDGWADRSPCGSGTSARLALLAADGRLAGGRFLTHDSIIGTRFIGRVRRAPEVFGHAAVIPEVEGMAYETGEHTFTLQPADPLETGFVLR
ncbi:MAG: proline racemase family protein [Microbacteriaceae bacterium]